MRSTTIEKDGINEITEQAPIREKAFFTIMRQSGLTPDAIKHLKIKDLEGIPQPRTAPRTLAPYKINVPQANHPSFIGQEAMNYIIQYLNEKSRITKLTPESPLFSARDNPNKEINTKNVSRTFTKITGRRVHLYSLHRFFQKNASRYLSELKEISTPKDDEFCRKLYEKEALQKLEIELPMEMRQLRKQQQEELEKRDREINALKERIRKLQPLLEWIDSTEPEIEEIIKGLGINARHSPNDKLHSYKTREEALAKAKDIQKDDDARRKLARIKKRPLTQEDYEEERKTRANQRQANSRQLL
jgi:hypothetical protein